MDRLESPQCRSRATTGAVFLVGAAVGAVGAYLCEPGHGRRRRRVLWQRGAAAARRSERLTRVAAARAVGRSKGLAHRLYPGPVPELDDVELAHKVESIVFRDPRRPKGPVSMNAENGCVVLRGQLESAGLIADLERAVRAVRGVRDVENLLHLPGEPPPERRPRGRAS